MFLGALTLFSLSWFYSLSKGDFDFYSGKSIVGALRVLGGEIPYRDFWTMYAPGHFYLMALLFRVFGTHLMVNVVAASVVCAAAACALYWLCLNLVGRRPLAISCVAIYMAAIYHFPYFKRLGSYPPAILFIFLALNIMVLYYQREKRGYLVTAGFFTGVVAIFKHDVGGYTAFAIVSGLMAHHLLIRRSKSRQSSYSLLTKLISYSSGIATIFLPLLIYFAVCAGPDMLQDLIIFPATDFRFSRPEWYPSLLPFWIYHEWRLMMFVKFLRYLIFNVPFVLFLIGLISTSMAWRKHRPVHLAAGVTFSVGYLLHYVAAHTQINTHIITLSVYAACLGSISYDLLEGKLFGERLARARLLFPVVVIGWFLSLSARPAYDTWQQWNSATAELELARISGFKATPQEAHALVQLASFVDNHLPENQEIFVGLHRHDVVIMGDTMVYFILNRPSGTRYHELHPAITDTASVQREIIHDLQNKNIPLIVLKHFFSDEILEKVKKDFLKNLPYIGASDLDQFIRANYVKSRIFGPYSVWEKKDRLIRITETRSRGSGGNTPE